MERRGLVVFGRWGLILIAVGCQAPGEGGGGRVPDGGVDVAVDVPTAEIRFEADALAKLPTWLPVDGAGSWVLTGQHPRQSRPGWLRCNADLPTEFTSAIPAEIEFPELWVAWIITR